VVVYQNGKKLGVSNQLTEVVGPAPPGQVAQTPASVEVDMHMSLPPDHLGAGNIVVHNQCKEPERFEVASGQFPPFMRLAEGPSFEIAAHDQRPIELKFDSKGLKAGGHEGTAVVTCLTCKKTPDCVEVRQVVHVFLEVLPEVAKQDTGGSTGGGDAKPGDTKAGDTKTGDTKTTAVGPTPDKPHDPLPPDQTQKQPERSAKSTKHDPVPDVPLPAPPDQTGSAAAPVAPAAGAFVTNLQAQIRGVVRIGSGTIIETSPADAVSLFSGASFEVRNDTPSTIRNNTGFAINCGGGEASYEFTAGSLLFSGNNPGGGGVDINPSCSGF